MARDSYIDRVPEVSLLRVPTVDPEWYTIEERDILLETCKQHKPEWYAYFFTAFRTGLRAGEMAALRWDDVELIGPYPHLRVRHSRRRKPKDGIRDKSTKNGKARTVPLSPALVEVLKAHRHLGKYVFLTPQGEPLGVNGATKALQWLCRKAGLKVIHRHAMRHSFASHVVQRTGNIVAVQELLGHADLTMARRYSHLAPSYHQEVVAALDAPDQNVNLSKKVSNSREEGVVTLPKRRERPAR